MGFLCFLNTGDGDAERLDPAKTLVEALLETTAGLFVDTGASVKF